MRIPALARGIVRPVRSAPPTANGPRPAAVAESSTLDVSTDADPEAYEVCVYGCRVGNLAMPR